MGKNDHEHGQDCDHDQSIGQQDEVQIQEQVINKIKELPTLHEKIQAIALDGYLIQKRNLDKALQDQNNALEWEFREKYRNQVEEIQKIVQGTYAFTEQDYKDIGDLLTEDELKVKENYFTNEAVPQYWLKVLMASDVIGSTITPKDEPILRHLKKIEASRNKEGTSIQICFFFSENEWFSNASIKKQFEIEGDNINKSFGDKIEWKQGKNVTVKIVKKKNKKKKETKTKIVKEESFFNFFTDIDMSDQDEEQQEENEESEKQIQELQAQYQIANSLYESVVPRSMEYFLGIVGAGCMGDFDIPEEDQQEEEDEAPKKKKKQRKASKGSDSGN